MLVQKEKKQKEQERNEVGLVEPINNSAIGAPYTGAASRNSVHSSSSPQVKGPVGHVVHSEHLNRGESRKPLLIYRTK